jgi:VPDSG-CTERM motif
MKIIRKYALAGVLAMALACNANAKGEEKPPKEEKQPKEEKVKPIDALPDGKKDKGPYSVPDGGSTVALLGVSVALVELARRKIAKSGVIV